MEIPFWKYQGTGNDFVILDNRAGRWEKILTQPLVAQICHRRMGIGADGLMLLNASDSHDFYMQYYNSDGRESTMCGNGGRCLVAFAREMGIQKPRVVFEAVDGLHEAFFLENGDIRLGMARPSGLKLLGKNQAWIDTGSPHVVSFLEEDLGTYNVLEEGKRIRNSEAYAPGGTNVNFVAVEAPDLLKVRTFERGVENETLSCGTGVTAAAYTHLARSGKSEGKIEITTLGGTLFVEVFHLGKADEGVFLEGPALQVFSGSYIVNKSNG